MKLAATDSDLHPVMILAGGTGGHIFPGLAVAHALHDRGVPVLWLGAEGGMETRLVPQHGFSIDTIEVRAVRGKGIATLLAAPFRVLGSVRAASHAQCRQGVAIRRRVPVPADRRRVRDPSVRAPARLPCAPAGDRAPTARRRTRDSP